MKTGENVEKVKTHVRTDRRLGIRMRAEGLDMATERMRQI
jgi:hypothetical protein